MITSPMPLASVLTWSPSQTRRPVCAVRLLTSTLSWVTTSTPISWPCAHVAGRDGGVAPVGGCACAELFVPGGSTGVGVVVCGCGELVLLGGGTGVVRVGEGCVAHPITEVTIRAATPILE